MPEASARRAQRCSMKCSTATDDRRRDLDLVYQGLEKFSQKFERDAYDDPRALDIYRVIAGLVEERGGKPVEPDRSTAA